MTLTKSTTVSGTITRGGAIFKRSVSRASPKTGPAAKRPATQSNIVKRISLIFKT